MSEGYFVAIITSQPHKVFPDLENICFTRIVDHLPFIKQAIEDLKYPFQDTSFSDWSLFSPSPESPEEKKRFSLLRK